MAGSRYVVAALVLAASACAGAPRKPPAVTPPASAPPPPPEAPAEPARWFRRNATQLWGPTLAEGTLVLIGGRRALVTRGHVRFETAQAPEPLLDLQVVPTAGGALKIVGAGARGTYRFDDPLGPGTPIARAAAGTKINGLDVLPGLVRVSTERERQADWVGVEDGRRASPPPGLPPAPALALVFAGAREGAGLFEGVGPAVTADGGATWRLLRETAFGELTRTRTLRFVAGAVEARDSAGRGAGVDVASAMLGRRPGDQPAESRNGADRPPPPPIEGEAPLAYWLRATEQSPLTYAIQSGLTAPGREGKRIRVDLSAGRLVDVEGTGPDASWWQPGTRSGPSYLSRKRQASIGGLDGELTDGGPAEPHVEIARGGEITSLAPVRFEGEHGALSLSGSIEEDADQALRFVLRDERQAYMVIQRGVDESPLAVPIPGATHALVHGAHGLAVGPASVLASADGGVTWSALPTPPDLAAEIEKLRNFDMVVSAAGARVGDFVRLGWGPPEPLPPALPTEGTEVPPPEPAPAEAPQLTCTSGAPTKAVSPIGPHLRGALEAAVLAGLKRFGVKEGSPSVAEGPDGPFTSWMAYAFDDATRTTSTAWLDVWDIGGRPRTFAATAPAWAPAPATLRSLAMQNGKALLVYDMDERSVLVRVEPDGATDVSDAPKREVDIQGEVGFAAARRGAVSWIEGGRLWLWRWGEPARAVLDLPGPFAAISAARPVPEGVVIRLAGKGYAAHGVLPYPAPGRALASPSLEGWTRFDAAAEHPERLPACDAAAGGVEIDLGARALHARIDGRDRRTETGASYLLRSAGGKVCVVAISAYFAEGGPPEFVRAHLVSRRADGGGDDVRQMTCAWR